MFPAGRKSSIRRTADFCAIHCGATEDKDQSRPSASGVQLIHKEEDGSVRIHCIRLRVNFRNYSLSLFTCWPLKTSDSLERARMADKVRARIWLHFCDCLSLDFARGFEKVGCCTTNGFVCAAKLTVRCCVSKRYFLCVNSI